MKFKKVTAVLLSAATLAAAPSLPAANGIWQNTAITAEAADTIIAQFSQNNLSYQICRTSSGSTYAAVSNCSGNLTSASIPATVTYQGTSYPVTRIKAYAFWGSTIQAVAFNSTNLTIETNSFCQTSRLSTMAAQSSVQNLTIEQDAFKSSSIQTFSCYARNCTINGLAFENSKLYSITFGTQVQSVVLGSEALADTPKLTKVIFNNYNVSVTLGSSAFRNSAVRDLSLPASVTSIPSNCFENCSNLVNLSLPSTLTTIGYYAFKNAVLPSALSIPAATTNINSTAFSYVKGVSAYYVSSGNTAFKSVNGVIFKKDGKTLCAYPANKSDTTYTSTCTSLWEGSISNTKYLKTLNLPNFSCSYSLNAALPDNTALEAVNVKSSESSKTAQQIISAYSGLFTNSKLNSFNGQLIITNLGSNAHPQYSSKFNDYIMANFEKHSNRSFVQMYVDQEASWVVNHYTSSSMSKLQKAVRLHEWLCDHVIYDPDTALYDRMKEAGQNPPSTLLTQKNHVDASAFMHKKADGKYYTVCDGYARAYKILMDKAGIPTDYVSGSNRFNSNLSGHAWNLVKLDGTWYHVDVTWDDNNVTLGYNYPDGMVPDSDIFPITTYARRYENFLCSDAEFARDGHNKYEWASREHPELNRISGAAPDDSLAMRGDLDGNYYFTSDDLVILQQYVLGSHPLYGQNLKKADINKDGSVDSFDVTAMRQYLNQYDLWSPAALRYSYLEY